jgi:hypothetical protein
MKAIRVMNVLSRRSCALRIRNGEGASLDLSLLLPSVVFPRMLGDTCYWNPIESAMRWCCT